MEALDRVSTPQPLDNQPAEVIAKWAEYIPLGPPRGWTEGEEREVEWLRWLFSEKGRGQEYRDEARPAARRARSKVS